jgi:hypothetical protein
MQAYLAVLLDQFSGDVPSSEAVAPVGGHLAVLVPQSFVPALDPSSVVHMILLLGGLLGKKRPGPAAQIAVCEAKRRARGKAVGAVHLSRKGLRLEASKSILVQYWLLLYYMLRWCEEFLLVFAASRRGSSL